MFSVGSAAFARAFRRFLSFRSRWLKKAQKSAKRRKSAQKGARKRCSSLPGTASALEEAVRACFGAPVRSKRLFETAVRDRYSKVLGSATFCSEPLCSALLCSVHVYICTGPH